MGGSGVPGGRPNRPGQALLTPVGAGGDPAEQVADAASDLSAMRWDLLLDAPLLLFVPAVLIVGAVAGARQARTAAIGSGVAFMGTLAAVFLLAWGHSRSSGSPFPGRRRAGSRRLRSLRAHAATRCRRAVAS
jgi:hypothetical protein